MLLHQKRHDFHAQRDHDMSQLQGDIPEVVMNKKFVINMDTILSGY
jgi:hypothetical protein